MKKKAESFESDKRSDIDADADADADATNSVVLNYLRHVSNSLLFLKQNVHVGTTFATINSFTHTNVEKHMDTIARDLIHLCHPKRLSSQIPNIAPTYMSHSHALFQRNNSDALNANDNVIVPQPTKMNSKKDILRNILYNLAPMAYDIATRIATIVIQSITVNTKSTTESAESEPITLQAFILFSFWIEQAPQIAPVVSDLFHLPIYKCPFDHALDLIDIENIENHDNMDIDMNIDVDMNMDVDVNVNVDKNDKHILIPITEMLIISEAIYKIIAFYSKRDEHNTLISWWQWTKIYSLLSYYGLDGDEHETMALLCREKEKIKLFIEQNRTKLSLMYDSSDSNHHIGDDGDNNENENYNDGILKPLPNYGYSSSPNQIFDHKLACKWFIGRAIAHLHNLSPSSKGIYLQRLHIQNDFVPWVSHPWNILDERKRVQELQLKRKMSFFHFSFFTNTNNNEDTDMNMDVNDNEKSQSGQSTTQQSHVYAYKMEEVIIDAPSPLQIRTVASLHPALVHLGDGIILPRRNTISFLCNNDNQAKASEHNVQNAQNTQGQGLIITPTTSRNLQLLGTAMSSDPYPPPILVCGPRGSGKSTLIRELANLCASSSSSPSSIMNPQSQFINNELLELHVDEETDSKTLIGSYAATDIPGEFTWRPGALTSAVRSGKWVLLEDVECCPIEIQAALVKLFEERVLSLGGGKKEKCHPNFRMFGTCTTSSSTYDDDRNNNYDRNNGSKIRKSVIAAGGGGKRLLHPGLWRKVHVDPLPYSELTMLSRKLYPSLPNAVCSAILKVFKMLDRSGRSETNPMYESEIIESQNEEEKKKSMDQIIPFMGNSGRHSSVRDLVKLLRRIASTIRFEPGVIYCTESQRILCMAECYDVFIGWNPCKVQRKNFAIYILAPAWGISATAAATYLEQRQPSIQLSRDLLEVGRCKIRCSRRNFDPSDENNNKFADTNYALRLMEAAGISIGLNESTLLVGGE